MTDILALIASSILATLSIFQFSLALGAPLGKFAWGGSQTVLPTKLRIASLVSIALYGSFATFILSKAGLVQLIDNKSILSVGIWIFTVYFFIGVIMNGISRSKYERFIMTPIVLVLAVMFLIVAQS